MAICRGLAKRIEPMMSTVQPSAPRVTRSTGVSLGGMGRMKLASLGQSGMHLSQVRQSNRTSVLPTLLGGVAFSAAL